MKMRRLFALIAGLFISLGAVAAPSPRSSEFQQQDQQEQQQESNPKDFFLSCQGVPLWQVCQSISEYYNVNVVVFDDLKDKLIFADVSGCDLVDVLDLITWLLGVEWVERAGQYYIGGNQSKIMVFPSLGIDQKIEAVFPNAVKLVNDKLIVQGSERELKRISDSLSLTLDRQVARCQLKVIEVVYSNDFQVGLDWEKSFDYGVSWENMLKNVHPVTHLAMSAKASLQLDQAVISTRYLVDTQVGILSGSKVSLQIGDETDRPVYSTSEYGNRVISGYSTQETGLLIDLSAYNSGGVWVFDSSVEHSRPVSDVKKTLSKVTTQVLVSDTRPFLLANVSSSGREFTIEQGVPFLCRIPYIGFLFGVFDKVQTRRDFYVCIRLIDSKTAPPVPPSAVPAVYQSLDDVRGEIN